MFGYGYLLLQGANFLSDGSELRLEVLSPGLIGGLLLPVLGALPDALVIAVSGLGASAGEAQAQVRESSLCWKLSYSTAPWHLQFTVCLVPRPGSSQNAQAKSAITIHVVKISGEQVAVGVGTLAGSTIMLLTITWAGSLLCARCDLNDRVLPPLQLRLLLAY